MKRIQLVENEKAQAVRTPEAQNLRRVVSTVVSRNNGMTCLGNMLTKTRSLMLLIVVAAGAGETLMAATLTGTPATLYTPNGQQHVFFRGTDNGIYQVFYDPGTNSVRGPEQWAPPDPNGRFMLGNPATLYTPGQQHVFYITALGALMHTCFDDFRGRFTETWVQSGAAAGSTPATLYDSNGQQHVFYLGSDSGIYQVFYDPGTNRVGSPEKLDWSAIGDPAAMYTPGQQHVFYRDLHGRIFQRFYDGSRWRSPEEWPPNEFTGIAASNLAPLYAYAIGQQHVFYRGFDNGIYHVFYDPGSNSILGPEKWASGAVGTPATMYHPNGQQHVFYRGNGNDGALNHAFYDPSTNSVHHDRPWAFGAIGDPATMYDSRTGQQHVFYQGSGGGLYHVFYDPSANRVLGPERWF
jgi:hypothetical protein